ncbi:hypothetical protein Dsin_016793 [Dipteronia sinensis]|uniref:HAT C-terminal dimerisation domain-containing protein n=1 Tax=Dipteronia sinensis TaxID=43782 RepID=A0AAE0AF42_9ROSI|nr:hypothetical protein Dsin_016793 [Dipteronia sinensis]
MDRNHLFFPDGLNILNGDLDLFRPTGTEAGPSNSAVTPTSCPKRFTSNVWQCFDIVEMTISDGTTGPKAKYFAHTTENIFNVIIDVLETYGITNRILSITLDIASVNTSSVALFTERNIPQARGYFFHQRIYERRFGDVDTQPSTELETQPMQRSWSILKWRKKSSSSSSMQGSATSSGAELNRYLEAQFDVCEDTEKFDLLLWWKTYSYRYPVMSHLAGDVLVIPVSAVSSEQALSMSR